LTQPRSTKFVELSTFVTSFVLCHAILTEHFVLYLRYSIREYAMGRVNAIRDMRIRYGLCECDMQYANRLRAMSNCKVAFSATIQRRNNVNSLSGTATNVVIIIVTNFIVSSQRPHLIRQLLWVFFNRVQKSFCMCTSRSVSCQLNLIKMLASVSIVAGSSLFYPGQSWWWRNVALL